MISEALRMIRMFHDLSQKELAPRLQIAPSHLSEIEAGKKQPTLQLLERYSIEFGIPVSSIMFFSEKMETGSRAERLRLNVSEKVLALLRVIAIRAGRETV